MVWMASIHEILEEGEQVWDSSLAEPIVCKHSYTGNIYLGHNVPRLQCPNTITKDWQQQKQWWEVMKGSA